LHLYWLIGGYRARMALKNWSNFSGKNCV